MCPSISLFSFSISTYSLMMVVAFLALGILCYVRRKRYRLKGWQACISALLISLSALIGAKLLSLLEGIGEISFDHFSLGSGFSLFGGVFLVTFLSVPIGKLFHLNALESMDYCAPPAILAIAFLRFGCFLGGCCGGIEMRIAGFSLIWPTQAIESICSFVIVSILLTFEQNGEHKGQLGAFSLISYGAVRFIVEFVRDTPKDWLYFSHGQWFAVTSVLVGFLILYILKRRKGMNK